MSAPERIAVVDIGSNSTRLLLAERVEPDGAVGERTTTITGLRRGAGADGCLADDAIARVDAELSELSRAIRTFGPDLVVPVGTSAVRDAPNRDRVGEVVTARLGARLLVLSGVEEATLSYRGARMAHPEGRALVADIGGGSTEMVAGEAGTPSAAVSMQLGAVRCTESMLPEDPPSSEARGALREAIAAEVAVAVSEVGAAPVLIGVAGTFTTLAAVDLGRYDARLVHRHVIPLERLVEMVDRLARMPLERRKGVPGLHPQRAPYIVAGGEIAVAVLRGASAAEVTISERDLLDGVALAAHEGRLPGGVPR